MRIRALGSLVGRDLVRGRAALVAAILGLAAGIAALVFFVALGLGARRALFGKAFAPDRVELEPRSVEPSALEVLVGSAPEAPTLDEPMLERLRAVRHVARLYPKLRFAFPAKARGGRALFGYDFTVGELLGDGVDPALVGDDRTGVLPFEDPYLHPGVTCRSNDECAGDDACDRPFHAETGTCVAPVPVLVSPYLVELFDRAIAPAHHLPPIARTAIEAATGIVFELQLGESFLGKAKTGAPRTVRARVVGLSSHAIDLGVTLPLETVRRLNAEFAGEASSKSFSSVLVDVDDPSQVGGVIASAESLGLQPRDTRARDVAVLVTVVVALLSLVALALLGVAASNIAQTLGRWAVERRTEIGLYRALGARKLDIAAWLLAVAATVGALGGALGVIVARALAFGADRLARTQLPDFPFKPETFFDFPWTLVTAGVGFSIAFAVVGASFPATRAARLDPVRALAGT